ncbi:MAG: pyroglutamyl-peptidase I [Xanthobacteraceae bacterium]|uniref:pyroglutamyl-peptidase I family protein n=1 Tax=Pseudolabrys sp. TaxID=1960880 RepID=UPI003D0D42DE
MKTILVTGFGPYPGAPYNPTAALVSVLTRHTQRGSARIVGHVFTTSYAAVDRDLPKLIKAHKPDALLMFGLAPRTRFIRIETRARNGVAMTPDATRGNHRRLIEAGAPFTRPLPAPAARLAAALRRLPVPARLSHDAGRYLCNYASWRAAEAAGKSGPRIAAFVHVPLVRRDAPPTSRRAPFSRARLERAGKALLADFIALANRH